MARLTPKRIINQESEEIIKVDYIGQDYKDNVFVNY